ncbi:SDR family NAD(P)-dependent oxidoreductase [Alkalilimnicola ehrlichii MLHE-1]|uniref:Short-chain dehydrogenase/reductase SDR n=1 Tax=Alkalilimnicola ehrlichii (strain ATCC BAA-1101 / DSM 17681 / MLHE-1) TaxID=187272 RepID=Q0A8T7_ALKEH|nr:SDR family NAD(P)-dependent oxidoreductase [Alkalilimnicola ehrlichii]ABI56750.1 short-chain dehydrogenase/reductase SDR [Alkalilimnicola ehrlichii MLHE-1]
MSRESMEWSLVTGGGTGLGRALALALAARGQRVIITGRRPGPLEATATAAPDGAVVPVPADVAQEEGRQRIGQAVDQHAPNGLRFLIHNAGTIDPIGPLTELDPEQWRRSQAINVEGPLFLTRSLLSRLPAGSRVLHISSGAAHSPIPGWGAYCTAKAALHMLYQCLDGELRDRGIRVGSLRPGVVDTPMQAHIRASSEAAFPLVERFRALHREGELRSAEEVADFACWVLSATDDDRYASSEWNISDPEQTRDWQRSPG